ncbi:hypothetical protein ASPWEDRAFT_37109 [Aspergillus wentii DTO 134E9]|uniref:Uncharacterized protein n=1 Tax=Aspergillus wentii DTO 134E9 TaxID=1073089 RepID=A0A1L9RWP5_ASPWE|nr:uncharacterized protein ASPWEDRAFT_37109 [Aspergillus wentii DTO 134E9]OJJ39345.1 hypothetical protein ASPWEDRAFT_37109 [Aspergillus wentii DTO 134E9]
MQYAVTRKSSTSFHPSQFLSSREQTTTGPSRCLLYHKDCTSSCRLHALKTESL